MPLVYDHNPTGLVVAREGAGESTVRRALKQHDPRLMLDYVLDTDWGGRQVWQVMVRVSGDAPPHVVCRWRNEQTGEPLELSLGLVEKVRALDLNSRAPKVDPDAENQQMRDALIAAADAEIEWYGEELVKRLKGTTGYLLPRGAHRRNREFPNVTDVR